MSGSMKDGRGARTAVILGLVPHPRSVAVIRSLGRAGIDLVGFDHEEPTHRSRSRYLKAGARHIEESPDAVLRALLEGAAEPGSVLIPTSDEYLLLLSRNHERLSERYVVTCPPWPVLENVMNIVRCYDLARACGIATPDYFQAKSARDLDAIVRSLDCAQHDYIVRTMPGCGPANPHNNRFTRVAGTTRESIRETCDEVHARLGIFPTIVEVVPGEADSCLGVSLVADRNSEPVVAYCVRRLRLYTYVRDMCRTGRGMSHPYELGSLVYCESHHDPEAMDKAFALVKAARYSGPITVEFRRNVVDGRLVLIKCDPRVVRATSLSTALGLDVPQALVDAFTATVPPAARTRYREGVGWLWITQYAEAIWNNREDVAVRRELLRLFSVIWRVRAFAFLSLTDPLPFVTHLAWRVRQRLAMRRRVHRAGALPAATGGNSG